ncbi:MAG: hypothetical protein R3C51_01940 [Parvularculaceae bacterium]
MSIITGEKTPWHLWAVGVFGVLWNGFGCFDYVMTTTRGAEYMRAAGMSDAQIEHLLAAPAWMTAVWAVGVWGGLAGAVLLLLRSKLAVPVFIVSLAAYVASLVYAYAIAPMPGDSAAMMVIQAIIFGGCVFFIWYSSRAKSTGLLR